MAPVLHQFEHDRLLRVQAVLGLLEDDRPWRVDDFIGDLIAAVGGQAVEEQGVGLGTPEKRPFTW